MEAGTPGEGTPASGPSASGGKGVGGPERAHRSENRQGVRRTFFPARSPVADIPISDASCKRPCASSSPTSGSSSCASPLNPRADSQRSHSVAMSTASCSMSSLVGVAWKNRRASSAP